MKSREDQTPGPREIIEKKARLRIYQHMLAVAEANQTKLSTVHGLIEKFFSGIYQHNEKALRTEVGSLLTSELTQKADKSIMPYLETLRGIQTDLAALNEEIKIIPKHMKLLHEQAQSLDDVEIQKKLDANINHINTLGHQYGEALQKLHKQTAALLRAMAMQLGDSKNARPEQKKELDAKLKELHEQVLELKEQAKEKRKHLQKMDNTVSSPKQQRAKL